MHDDGLHGGRVPRHRRSAVQLRNRSVCGIAPPRVGPHPLRIVPATPAAWKFPVTAMPSADIPVVGQLSRPVALFMITTCHPREAVEDIIRRAMLGEKIEIRIGMVPAYVFRNNEFDNWWLVNQ